MPRFVVLRHEIPKSNRGDVHWDLMLELDGVLRTWALEEEPTAGEEIAADALADHRLAYLDYEGPVSGDRGTVKRWDAGEYQIEIDLPAEVHVRLQGRALIGTAILRKKTDSGQRWTFDFST